MNLPGMIAVSRKPELLVPIEPVPGIRQFSCICNIIMHDFVYFRALRLPD
jgi:hypothetical protein